VTDVSGAKASGKRKSFRSKNKPDFRGDSGKRSSAEGKRARRGRSNRGRR